MKTELLKYFFFSLLFISVVNCKPGTENRAKMCYISGGYYTSLYSVKNSKKELIKPFYMDKYPVTNTQYLIFVKANPAWSRSKVKRIFADKYYLIHWKSDYELGTNINAKSPVTNVSWFAAKAYAEWAGKRLPTVAEWEFVASASLAKPDALNDKYNIERIQQWYSKKSDPMLKQVGTTEKNYWGVYDLFGLIWEWQYDFNTAMVSGDSRGDSNVDRNYFCGGGALTATDAANYPAFMRYGFRSSLQANYTCNNLGFRCVNDLTGRKLK